MRITFVGAGAVGGYFGLQMARAGLDVSFLLRQESARALRAHGLRVRGPGGEFSLPRPDVLDGSESIPAPDVVFFACKAEHVRDAAGLAKPLMGPHTLAVPLQNGVDAPDALAGVLGPACVLGGLSRIFAERESPGRIVHRGLLRPSIACGELGAGVSARVRRIVEAVSSAPGMFLEASEDIWSEMWKKLLMVCSIGAVGAVARAPLGVLLGVPETRSLLCAAGDEIAAVARARGATVAASFARQQTERYTGLPAETTASMQRDLERGFPSELHEQLGAVCRYGREGGVRTPVLDALFGALLPAEMRARSQIAFDSVVPPAT